MAPWAYEKDASPVHPIFKKNTSHSKKAGSEKIFENHKILRTPLRCSATASSFGSKCPLGRSPNGHFGSELSTLLRAAQWCAQNLVILENFR